MKGIKGGYPDARAILRDRRIPFGPEIGGPALVSADIRYPLCIVPNRPRSGKSITSFMLRRAKRFARHIRSRLLPAARRALRRAGAAGFEPYRATLSYRACYNHPPYLSIVTHAAAGPDETERRAATFDITTGRRVRLSDLFLSGRHIDLAVQRLTMRAAQAIGGDPGEALSRAKQAFDPRRFYLTERGVCFIFRQNDIPDCTLPYALLTGMLRIAP